MLRRKFFKNIISGLPLFFTTPIKATVAGTNKSSDSNVLTKNNTHLDDIRSNLIYSHFKSKKVILNNELIRLLTENNPDRKICITRGIDKCILIYPGPSWDKLEMKLTSLPSLNSSARILQRVLIGFLHKTTLSEDRALHIPRYLVDIGRLNNEIELFKIGNRIEIWDKVIFNSQLHSITNKRKLKQIL